MRIAVNMHSIKPWFGGGEEHYLRRVFQEIVHLHDGLETVFLTDADNDDSFGEFETHQVAKPEELSAAVSAIGADVLFTPMCDIPGRFEVPVVVLAMQVYDLRKQQQATKKRLLGGGNSPARATIEFVQRAAQVVTPSEFMRQEVLEFLNVPLNKIVVAPLGIDDAFGKPQHGIMEPPFILTVGRMLPRKNLEVVLEAFQRISDEIPHNLVIVGQPIENEPASWGQRIIRIDRLGTVQLAGLFQSCEMLVVPSLYEGSGVLVQEALKAGGTVVSSRIKGITDVAGKAPLYFEPEHVDALAKGILRVTEESEGETERRHTLGKQLTVEVSWEHCARQTLSAFRRALTNA